MCCSVTLRGVINETSDAVLHAGSSAFIGSLCSHAFHLMNPIHGAVFSAISSLVSRIVNPIFNAIFIGKDPNSANDSSIVLGTMLSVISGTAISAALSTHLGYPVTLYAGLTLTAAIFTAAVLAALAVTILGACLRGDHGRHDTTVAQMA